MTLPVQHQHVLYPTSRCHQPELSLTCRNSFSPFRSNKTEPTPPRARATDTSCITHTGAKNEPPPLEVDEDGRVVLDAAVRLLRLGERLPVAPPSVPTLRAAVARHQAFEAKTAQVCADAAAWQAWHAARAAAKASGADAAAAAAGTSAPPPLHCTQCCTARYS